MHEKEYILRRGKEKQLQFGRHTMKKVWLENLTVTGHIYGKRDGGKQRANYMVCLYE